MIRPLEALIQQLRVQAPLGGALGDQAAQRFGLKVVRTGTARKNAPVFHELQAQIVDPAVGVEALFGVLLALDEGRGIDADHAEFPPPVAQRRQRVQRVAGQRFAGASGVGGKVAACHVESLF